MLTRRLAKRVEAINRRIIIVANLTTAVFYGRRRIIKLSVFHLDFLRNGKPGEGVKMKNAVYTRFISLFVSTLTLNRAAKTRSWSVVNYHFSTSFGIGKCVSANL
jgi:hypothetical protein